MGDMYVAIFVGYLEDSLAACREGSLQGLDIRILLARKCQSGRQQYCRY